MARDDNFELSWLKMFLTRNIVTNLREHGHSDTLSRVQLYTKPILAQDPFGKMVARTGPAFRDGKICEVDGVASLTERGYTWRNRTKEV